MFRDINYERQLASDRTGLFAQFKKVVEMNTRYTSTHGFIIKENASFYTLLNNRYRDFEIFENNMRITGSEVDVDKFIAEQKAKGVDNIVKELQKHVDIWKASINK